MWVYSFKHFRIEISRGSGQVKVIDEFLHVYHASSIITWIRYHKKQTTHNKSYWRRAVIGNSTHQHSIWWRLCDVGDTIGEMYHWYIVHCNDVIMSAMASQITSLTIVYSTVYSDANQRKHHSHGSLAFVRGIHRWPVNSIWWRHHELKAETLHCKSMTWCKRDVTPLLMH